MKLLRSLFLLIPLLIYTSLSCDRQRMTIDKEVYTPNEQIETVTFDANGGSIPVPLTKQVTVGKPYGMLATTSRAGYTFAGWNTLPDGSGDAITETSTVIINGSQTFYAQWNEMGGIYVFIGGSNNGDFTTGYSTGRAGADTRCASVIPTSYPFISMTTVRAMLSFKDDSLRDIVLPEHSDSPVFGITPDAVETRLADSWTDLLTEGPQVSLETAIGLTDNWWTGSDAAGNVVTDRCDNAGGEGDGWDDNKPTPHFGYSGSNTGLAGEWISSSRTNCNTLRFFLCVAY